MKRRPSTDPNEEHRSVIIAIVILVVGAIAFVLAASSKGQEIQVYTSPTCIPCQRMKPDLERLRGEGIKLREIDASQNPYIRRVPTFVAKDNADVTKDQWTGYNEEKIRSWWARISVPTDARRAVCKIQVSNERINQYGSGALVTNGQSIFIQTCYHIFSLNGSADSNLVPNAQITAYFIGDIKTRCKLSYFDQNLDLAYLEIVDEVCIEPLPIGQAKEGETYTWYGYNGGWKLHEGSGRLALNYDPVAGIHRGWLQNTTAASGDSGGPVINSEGEAVGVLWGTVAQARQVAFNCGNKYRAFFFRRLIPRNQAPPLRPGTFPRNNPPVTPPETTPIPQPPNPKPVPIQRDCKCAENFSAAAQAREILRQEIENTKNKLDSLQESVDGSFSSYKEEIQVIIQQELNKMTEKVLALELRLESIIESPTAPTEDPQTIEAILALREEVDKLRKSIPAYCKITSITP